MVSVHPSVCNVHTQHTDQRVEQFFKLVLRLVLERGTLYYSSLVLHISVGYEPPEKPNVSTILSLFAYTGGTPRVGIAAKVFSK